MVSRPAGSTPATWHLVTGAPDSKSWAGPPRFSGSRRLVLHQARSARWVLELDGRRDLVRWRESASMPRRQLGAAASFCRLSNLSPDDDRRRTHRGHGHHDDDRRPGTRRAGRGRASLGKTPAPERPAAAQVAGLSAWLAGDRAVRPTGWGCGRPAPHPPGLSAGSPKPLRGQNRWLPVLPPRLLRLVAVDQTPAVSRSCRGTPTAGIASSCRQSTHSTDNLSDWGSAHGLSLSSLLLPGFPLPQVPGSSSPTGDHLWGPPDVSHCMTPPPPPLRPTLAPQAAPPRQGKPRLMPAIAQQQ